VVFDYWKELQAARRSQPAETNLIAPNQIN
jgi:hypothetical protein